MGVGDRLPPDHARELTARPARPISAQERETRRVTDLLVGVAIIGLLSALLFVAARRVAPALPVRLTNLLAIFFIALMIAFVLLVQGRPFLARVLPFSNLIVVGNVQPL